MERAVLSGLSILYQLCSLSVLYGSLQLSGELKLKVAPADVPTAMFTMLLRSWVSRDFLGFPWVWVGV
jgi:hypothetical protein